MSAATIVWREATRSGTFDVRGLTYVVTDNNGATLSYDFSVAAVAAPNFVAADVTALDDGYTFRVGTAIAANTTLPQAQDGLPPLTHKLTVGAQYTSADFGANDIAFDASTRTLSGTPIAPSTNHSLHYHARDVNGATVSQATDLFIAASFTLSQTDIGLSTGQAVDFELTAPIGGVGTFAYTVAGIDTLNNLPTGVTFNPTERALQGTAPSNVVAEMTFEYTATDNFDGAVAVATFTITVTERPTFTPATLAATYTVGATTYTIAGAQSGAPLTFAAAVGGEGALQYAVAGDTPSGMTRAAGDGNTIVLSGAPNAAGETTFTRSVTDAAATPRIGGFTFIATVVAAPSFADTQDGLHATIGGVALDVNLPTATNGFAPLVYSIAPNLPSGLQLNASTANLSGVPDDVGDIGSENYVLTATDVHGASVALQQFAIEVYAALAFAVGDNPDDTTFTVGTSTALVFLAATGGRADLTYSIDGIDDVGGSNSLAFVEATRTLSGTFDVVSNDVGLTYVVTDANGATLSYAFTVAAVAAPNFAAADVTTLGNGYTFRVGSAIAANTALPQAQDGLAPLTYKLTVGATSQYASADFGANAVTFDASTRVLSGTPIAPKTNHPLNYHARDVNGATVSQATNIFIAASFTLSQANIGLAAGQAVDLTLTVASENVGAVVYTVSGVSGATLPGDITFNPTARALQGTAPDSAVSEMAFEYSATDGFDNVVAVATFTVTVTESPTFTPPTIAATYTVNATTYSMGGAQSGDALTLPAADGGQGVLAYVRGGNLPTNLTETADGGRILLTGAPSVADEYTFTRTVTDQAATPRSGEFTFIANVVAAPSFAAAQEKLHATIGAAISQSLLRASGGVAPLAYSLAPELPSGMQFDASAVQISGAPDNATDVGNANYTLTVVDVHGASAMVAFDLEVYAALAYVAGDNPGDTTFSVGPSKSIAFLAVGGGRSAYAYSLDGIADVSGANSLTFDANSRTLAGTFGVVTDNVGLTYIVADQNQASLSYAFNVAAVAAPTFSNAASTELGALDFRIGAEVEVTLPQATGGVAPLTHKLTVDSNYDSAGFNQFGLMYDGATRILSGTISAVNLDSVSSAYHVRDANGATGIASAPVDVYPRVTLAQDDLILTVGSSVDETLSSAQNLIGIFGIGSAAYTLTDLDGNGLDDLPSGVTFDAATHKLGGTAPSVATAETSFIYAATDDADGDSASVTFSITVADAPVFTPSELAVTFTITNAAKYSSGGAVIEGLTLPAASGGAGGDVYTNQGALPTGMSGAAIADEYAISDDNAPSAVGNFTFSRIIADQIDQQATFTLLASVVAAPSFAGAPSKIHATIGGIDVNVALPTANNGFGALTYSAAGLPANLAVDASTAQLTGALANTLSASDSQYTLRVVDVHDVSATLQFDLQVYAALAFVAGNNPPDTTFTVGTSNALVFLAATGGRAELTYSVDGIDDVGGNNSLAFVEATRTLSGTFDVVSNDVGLTYVAADNNGATVSYAFTVAAVAAPNFAAADVTALDNGYTFRAGTLIAANTTLPEAQNGLPPLTHKLTVGATSNYSGADFGANGVAFDASTRTLSGTPSAAASINHPLGYHARDANGAIVSRATNIYVASTFTVAQDNVQLSAGQSVNQSLSEASGGVGAVTYTIAGVNGATLPTGITFNPTARALQGTAPNSDVAEASFAYTALDDFDDDTDTVTFTLAVFTRPVFSPSRIRARFTVGASTYSVGNPLTQVETITLPAASGGAGNLVYSTSGSLPAGITQTADGNRILLTGTPTTATVVDLTFLRQVVDSYTPPRSGELTFIATVVRAPVFDEQIDKLHATIGGPALDENNAFLPYPRYGTQVIVYQVTPALPSGLRYDDDAHAIVGVPTNATDVGNQNYTLTAIDANGVRATVQFDLQVYAALAFAATPPTAVTYTIGQTQSQTLPLVNGGRAALTYSFDGISAIAASNNLTYDAATRIVSGSFAAAGSGGLTYTVADANSAALTHAFNVVSVAPVAITNAADLTLLGAGYTFRVGTAIAANTTLPVAAGGAAPITYKLTVGASSAYTATEWGVGGVDFDSSTRVLSGTPSAEYDADITYHARDANGVTDSQSTNMYIAASFALSQVDIGLPTSESVNQSLSAVSGAVGTIVYTVTGLNSATLPNGVTFDADDLALEGTAPATAVAARTFEYKATDDFDNEVAVATFVVTVNERPTFAPPAIAATYSVGATTYTIAGAQSADAITIPEASGGVGAVTYSTSGVTPPGMTRTSDGNRVLLSGAPNRAGDYTFTRTATDSSSPPRVGVFTFTANVVAAPAFAATQDKIHATIGGPALDVDLRTANNGYAPLVYGISPALPNHLAVNASTAKLSGVLAVNAGVSDARYTLTAVDVHGASGDLRFELQVYAALAFAAGNNPDDSTFTVGTNTPLNFLAVTGGRAAYAYSLDGLGDIGATNSLAFNANTRTLSGAFAATNGAVGLTYIAADANGATLSYAFNVAALAAPNFAAADVTTLGNGYTFRIGNAIAANTALPQAQDGLSPLTHKLTIGATSQYSGADFGASGVAFDASTRVLSGTPVAPSTNHLLNYHARDANGATASQSTNLFIAVPFALAQDNLAFATEQSVNLTLAEAGGAVGSVAYTVSGISGATLPTGVTFNATARALQGTAPATPTVERSFEYTATDNFDSVIARTTFTVTVNERPVFTPAMLAVSYTVGATTYTLVADGAQSAEAITLPSAGGGTGNLAYSIDGATPPGITRTARGNLILLSGAPNQVGEYTFVRIATDQSSPPRSGAFTFIAHVAALPVFASTQTELSFSVNQPQAANAVLITASGGVGDLAYSITPALSGGLMFIDAEPPRLGGTPNEVSNTLYRVQATDQNGGVANSAPFRIRIFAAPTLSGVATAYTFRQNVARSHRLPAAANGAPPLTHKLTVGASSAYGAAAFVDNSSVPGIAFDAVRRELSGAPSVVGNTAFAYHARDNNGAGVARNTAIEVVAALAFASAPPDITFSINQQNISVPLPAVNGVIGDATYSLINLPSWLRFDAATRQLTGNAPNAEQAVRTLTYRARDSFDGAQLEATFAMRVARAPAFTPSTIVATYTVGTATYTIGGVQDGDALTLPFATGGTGAIAYAETDNLPSGLNANVLADNRVVISGSPTQNGAFSYTRVAEDANNHRGRFTLHMFVAAAPSFGAQTIDDEKYSVGMTVDLDLPSIQSGGVQPISYSLTDAAVGGAGIDGLGFNARRLNGVVATMQTVTYRYTAHDANGVEATALAFVLEVVNAPTIVFNPATITYTVGGALVAANQTFVASVTDKPTTAVYTFSGFPPGLTVTETPVENADGVNVTFVLSGTPSEIGDYTVTLNVSEQGNDQVGASDSFAITVAAKPNLSQTAYSFLVTEGETVIETKTINLQAEGGASPVTYTLAFVGNVDDANAPRPTWLLAPERSFVDTTFVPEIQVDASYDDLVAQPGEDEPRYLFDYTATDANGATATYTLTFSLYRASADNFVKVNEQLLSDAAGAIASDTVSAVVRRIAQARDGQSARVSFAGQNTLGGMITAYGKSLADDEMDAMRLLHGTAIAMPLNANGQAYGARTGAVWLSGEYNDISGDTDELKWDGSLRSVHIGMDSRVGETAIGGAAVAVTNTEIEYEDIGENQRGGKGDYDLRLTTLNPYISWRVGAADLWAMLGVGSGELSINTDVAAQEVQADLRMRSAAFGAQGEAGVYGNTRLRIGGEMLATQIDVVGNDDISAQTVDGGLARLSGEFTNNVDLYTGGRIEPHYEFALRYDYGDSDLGAGFESAAGLRHFGIDGRFRSELRAHAMQSTGGEYSEWGVYALVRNESGADGQGLSLRVRPSYGASDGQVGAVWDGLDALRNADPDAVDYSMHIDSHLGYGVAGHGWRGVVTPFVEWSHADTNIYRMGANWNPSAPLQLRLVGERERSKDGEVQQSLLFKGEVRF